MDDLPFISTWIKRDVVDSTNNLAINLLAAGDVACPLLVTATTQTRGRGRARRSWWSDSGSLTFTVAIDPAAHGLQAEHEPRVALAVAVAVIDAVASWLPPEGAGIRWPNDVEIGKRKLGGILPERVETPRGARLAIGIGLNVLTRFEGAPAEVRELAASLAEFSASPLELEPILRLILAELGPALRLLAHDDPGLADRWNRLDSLRDRTVRLDVGTRIIRGIARGIDPTGALLVESDGVVVPHHGGQVLRP
jgi:BirA family biotin operon repressor/biotin-[acetyl-CoA-carboxylase] ligase